MPNYLVALLTLLIWPVITARVYRTRPAAHATTRVLVWGQLLLPVYISIDLPAIPPLDKNSIPSLAALAACVWVARQPVRWRRGFGGPECLIALCLIGPFITAETNTDALLIGKTVLPAMTHYDAVSAVCRAFIGLIPLFLGRQLLRRPEDLEDLLRVLAFAGLVYSLPMLFEVRMSPQLHQWLYGFFPHDFGQQKRFGGFRPVVFLGHGLLVAFFAMTAAVASAALWRARVRLRNWPPAGVTAYLLAVLLLCKSMGAMVFGALAVPLVRWTSPRLQLRLARLLAGLALLYPLLRLADYVPTDTLLEWAAGADLERAASLEFRFTQEARLLAHARERFLFGWGGWGRNRVYEAGSGVDTSTTDGEWIIILGDFGLCGFIGLFGLLALPVFRAATALRYGASPKEQVLLATAGLLLALNVVELLPNSSLFSWTWLLAGALLGQAETLTARAKARRAEPVRVATRGARACS